MPRPTVDWQRGPSNAEQKQADCKSTTCAAYPSSSWVNYWIRRRQRGAPLLFLSRKNCKRRAPRLAFGSCGWRRDPPGSWDQCR
eukprot:4541549-Pyramimonas_sp.AAC.1